MYKETIEPGMFESTTKLKGLDTYYSVRYTVIHKRKYKWAIINMQTFQIEYSGESIHPVVVKRTIKRYLKKLGVEFGNEKREKIS